MNKKDKDITAPKIFVPFLSFLSLLAIGILLGTISFLMPEKGIDVQGVTLYFPSIKRNFLIADTAKASQDTIKVTKQLVKLDTAAVPPKVDLSYRNNKKLQFPPGKEDILHHFFEALDQSQQRKIRIMHYGDSQIEGDRITGYVRNELQKKFGGYGVGLAPIIGLTKKISLNLSSSDNWKRHPGFGKKDTAVHHNKYGALISFSRFNHQHQSDSNMAWLHIQKPTKSYGKARSYHQLNLFLSTNTSDVYYQIEADNAMISEDTIPPSTPFHVIKANFKTTPEEIQITFFAKESPDFYGLSLEGNNGVVMDNIPLRGSSGTVFSGQDRTTLKKMYDHLSPDLILLEFGGNVLPHLKSEKKCKSYGKRFKAQIRLLQQMNPNASFIVIGPADMAIKHQTDFVTHPFLENVRDELREAALSTGCVFWDMYTIMGGENSMVEWVNAEPALACSDYIHFTRKGAKTIAKQLYQELMDEYEKYKTKP